MIKKIIVVRFVLLLLIAVMLNGCTFIVENEHAIKYYGIDEQCGSEYLIQVLDKQQQVYRTREASMKER